MIVEEKLGYLQLLFRVRGSVLPRIWRRVVITTAIAFVLTVFEETYPELRLTLTPVPFTLIGLALSIFLGFRNNTSYDRFWEGRRLWGALVNTSRTLARQLQLYLHVSSLRPGDDGEQLDRIREYQREQIHRVIAFAHALRMSLRREDPFTKLAEHLPAADVEALQKERNVPYAIVCGLSARVQTAWRRGWIDPVHIIQIDRSLIELENIQGGCERIRNTPIPFLYTVLIHRIVAVYCLLMPFGIYETVKMATPFVVMFLSYAFFGLDAIGEEIEDPFGRDLNDLPLLALSTMIEADLCVRLGEPPPAAIEPIDGDQLL
jgi:ion channel-forming bestrophin family protein